MSAFKCIVNPRHSQALIFQAGYFTDYMKHLWSSQAWSLVVIGIFVTKPNIIQNESLECYFNSPSVNVCSCVCGRLAYSSYSGMQLLSISDTQGIFLFYIPSKQALGSIWQNLPETFLIYGTTVHCTVLFHQVTYFLVLWAKLVRAEYTCRQGIV